MHKALVTGATGFVGSAVARALIQDGWQVRALARPDSNHANLAGLAVELCEGDVLDPNSIRTAVKDVDAVFHVAADYRIWVPDPDAMNRINVEGTGTVIGAALEAGVERVVYTSSVATLAALDSGESADEETPNSFENVVGTYKRSKFLAEELVRRKVSEENANIVIVNPSTPVGPGDIKPTPTGQMILRAVQGKIPAYVDTGLNIVHVDDVAQGHILGWKNGAAGERYILGGENLSLKDLLTTVAQIAGVAPPKIKLSPSLLLPVGYISETTARLFSGYEPFTTIDGLKMARKKMYFSSAKAQRELGYRHRPAHEALAAAARWFQQGEFSPGRKK